MAIDFSGPVRQAPGWWERALCAQIGSEPFFPEPGRTPTEAKRICLACEGRVECLEYALTHEERYGVWGGLSEEERRGLRRGRA